MCLLEMTFVISILIHIHTSYVTVFTWDFYLNWQRGCSRNDWLGEDQRVVKSVYGFTAALADAILCNDLFCLFTDVFISVHMVVLGKWPMAMAGRLPNPFTCPLSRALSFFSMIYVPPMIGATALLQALPLVLPPLETIRSKRRNVLNWNEARCANCKFTW